MSDLDDTEQFQTKHVNSVFDDDGDEGQQEDLIGEEEVGHSHSPGLTAIATQIDDDMELHSHRSHIMDDEMSLGLNGQMVTEIPLENPSTTTSGYHTPQLDTHINIENRNQEQDILFEVDHSESPVNVDIAGTASSTREGGKVRFGPALCQNGFSILAFVLVATGLVWFELVRWNEQDHHQSIAYIMIWICLIAAALGIAGLFTWIFFTQILLWFSQFVSIALVLLLAFVHILSTGGSTTVLFLCLILIIIMSYWLWRNHHRKQFAGVMLDLVAEVVQENPMLVVVAILVLFVQTLWLILFAVTCVEVLTLKLYGFAYIYLFFAAFWTTQVMKHIVHTTVAGTMAHWYFSIPVTGSRMRIPITCLKRSVTTSFGPICRGSLLVSPSRMLWAGFRHLNKWSHRFVVCLCEKLFWFTEALFHNFNKHAFTHVIMYGKDYASASRDTWDLFFAHGVDAIVRQDKVYTLALYPAIGCGCLLSIICAIWASHKQLYDEWLAMTCVAFAVGFSTVALTTEVMEGAVATIFACFAEDPRPLSSTHPTMFHRFVRIAELATFRDKRTVPI